MVGGIGLGGDCDGFASTATAAAGIPPETEEVVDSAAVVVLFAVVLVDAYLVTVVV